MEEHAPLSIQIKSEKKFLVEEDNKKYEIIFRLNDSSIDINLKDVKNKIFKIYDNLTEIYDNIIIFMEKKKYSIEIKLLLSFSFLI